MPHHHATAHQPSAPARTREAPDLGYHWIWTWGHLFPAILFGAAAAIIAMFGLPWWLWLWPALVAAWAFSAFLVMRFLVAMNHIPRPPSNVAFASDANRVLDVGCGSGRLCIAIARARPAATIVGLDNFSATYIRGHGEANTLENFRVAGIAGRATVRTGDMRDMPFEDHSFDLVTSSAAIDHLPEDEIRKTLHEVRRVLVPGGQFFLAVSVPNVWMAITFGPLVLPRLRNRAFWRQAFAEAGFTMQGEGALGASAWFLARSEPVGT